MNTVDVLPDLAPLPQPIAAHLLAHQESKLLVRQPAVASSLDEELAATEKRFHALWDPLVQQVRAQRTETYHVMTPVVAEAGLSTSWIMKALAQHGHRTVTAQTLSRWRDHRLLRYQQFNQPHADSAAALLIAGLIDKRVRAWLPPDIQQYEPLWWCWRQDHPQAPVIACPIPLPEDLPATALLWTPWTGASWDPAWFNVGQRGAIRWAGTRIVQGKHSWAVTLQDVQRWMPEVTPLGNGIEITPEILHTLANVALLHLASGRLQLSNAITAH